VIDSTKGKINLGTKFGAMLSSLSNFRLSYIIRQANNIVHLLEKVALSFAIRQELDYISSYIESILLNTMS
jgi:hypothetical protein